MLLTILAVLAVVCLVAAMSLMGRDQKRIGGPSVGSVLLLMLGFLCAGGAALTYTTSM